MGDPAVGDGELLDHAIAVEPVPVAPAEPVVNRGPVAEEAAFQAGRPFPGDGQRFRVEPVRRRFPADQHGVPLQGFGEGIAPVVAGSGQRRREGREAGQARGG